MNCYICGNAATKRMTPDLDIKGIELCEDRNCHQLLTLAIYTDGDTPNIERRIQKIRKNKHRERGNPLSNA